MTDPRELEGVLAALGRRGTGVAEVYAKQGRSRHFALGAGGEVVATTREAGWAVRAGTEDGRASFFVAATGEPAADFPWPDPAPAGLSLPGPGPEAGPGGGPEAGPGGPEAGEAPGDPPGWSEPEGLGAPLVGERQGRLILSQLAAVLGEELPGARLLSARLDDGASHGALASSTGVRAAWRSRAAALVAEAAGPDGASAGVEAAARHARLLDPRALARRLADRLTVASGEPPEAVRATCLLAPFVAARLLAGLVPLWTGRVRPAALLDRAGNLGSEVLTVVDDGRHPEGVLAAPVDGEGMPTRRVTLVEAGRFRQALAPWSRAGGEGDPSGCMRRASFRDLPAPGATHLFVEPSPEVPVATLLEGLEEGYYWIDAPAPAWVDLGEDRFRLAVRGFAVEGGRPRRAVAGAVLGGSLAGLLRGVTAAARDLEFFALDGMIGSPTLLVAGAEVAPGQE